MNAQSCLALPRALARRPVRGLAVVGMVLLMGAGCALAAVWLWATHHRRTGREALQHYHTAEAIAHLHAALSIWPRDPETLLLAARATRRTGAYDDADRLLDRYQELRPDDESLLLERVCVRAERGEPDSVALYCRSLIESDHPASALLFEALARGYLRTYQPQKATTVVHEWLQRQPENPQALVLQGQIHDLQLRQADAVQAYRAALTVDPKFDEARLRLCDALMQLGSAEDALPHLEFLRQRLPDNPKILVYLARMRDRQGRTQEAEQLLEEALALHAHYGPALAERGNLALRAGHTVEAEKWLRQAVQQDPSDYQAHFQLAKCLEQNGKSAEADKIDERRRLMEKDMLDIQALAGGGMERAPHNADLHYQIGMISLRAGALKEALRWLHSALQEDPKHQGAHKALMEHYQRIGDFSRAREHQRHLKTEEKH